MSFEIPTKNDPMFTAAYDPMFNDKNQHFDYIGLAF